MYNYDKGRASSNVDIELIDTDAEIFGFFTRKNGMVFIVVNAIIFGLLNVVQFAGVFGLMATFIIYGYMIAVFGEIVKRTINGDKAVDWDFYSDIDYGHPMDLAMAPLKLTFVFVLCFSPYWLYCCFYDNFLVSEVIRYGCYYYLPMALLAYFMLGEIRAVNPFVVLPAILRSGFFYFSCYLVLFLLQMIELYLGEICEVSFGLQYFLLPLVYVSSFFLTARVIGLVYYCKKDQINWF